MRQIKKQKHTSGVDYDSAVADIANRAALLGGLGFASKAAAKMSYGLESMTEDEVALSESTHDELSLIHISEPTRPY